MVSALGLGIGLLPLKMTVMVRFTGLAQNPAEGVKVYVPDMVLSITDGDHVPVMPLEEVVGNVGNVPPKQTTGVMLNAAVRMGLTVMVMVVGVAHDPSVGVKV